MKSREEMIKDVEESENNSELLKSEIENKMCIAGDEIFMANQNGYTEDAKSWEGYDKVNAVIDIIPFAEEWESIKNEPKTVKEGKELLNLIRRLLIKWGIMFPISNEKAKESCQNMMPKGKINVMFPKVDGVRMNMNYQEWYKLRDA